MTCTTTHRRPAYGHVALATLAALCIDGCRQSATPPPQRTVDAAKKVAVGVVRDQLLEETVELPATIESDETAKLMARTEAYVSEVLVDIGDQVEAGHVLIRLDAPELKHMADEQRAMIRQLEAEEQVLQAELQAARTQLDVVRAELKLKNSERDRLSRLVSSGAIKRQRLEEADSSAQSVAAMLARYENAVQVAEAKLGKGKTESEVVQNKLQAAEAVVDYLEIKAPFAGIVARRNVDPGNLVRPSAQGNGSKPLLTIAKVDQLRVIVHATVDVAGKLTVGDPVKFIPDDMPENSVSAELSRIAGAYDDRTRMMRAEIDLDNVPDPTTGQRPLRAGGYGSAVIVLRPAPLPVVPKSAVIRGDKGVSVVTVHNGRCSLTPVEVAIEIDDLVGIKSGLAAGNQIVVEKPDAIQTGQQLTDAQIDLVAW